MRQLPDDRRYMSFELRAVDDARYRGTLPSSAKATTTCRCGKTVTHANGVEVRLDGKPIICPRQCATV